MKPLFASLQSLESVWSSVTMMMALSWSQMRDYQEGVYEEDESKKKHRRVFCFCFIYLYF